MTLPKNRLICLNAVEVASRCTATLSYSHTISLSVQTLVTSDHTSIYQSYNLGSQYKRRDTLFDANTQ